MKAPKQPDPRVVADAQSGMNRDTAVSQQLINMVSSENPWGSVNYSQSGSTGYTDSNGKWVSIPQFTQTTTLSPEQQAIFDQSQAAQSNLAGIAENQSATVADTLSTPFQFNNQDAADWAYDLGATRLDPRFERADDALRTRLTNQGIREGSAAWNNAMSRQGETENDAYNQLMLTGRGQAFAENLATRNQPLNELTALLSGSQVSNPAQMSGPTPQASVGGVDYAGLVQDNYQSKLANYQAKMGGLFGLAGAGLQAGMMASDVRLKTDISRVGTLDNGLPVFAYRYKAGGPMMIGLMAQDVELVRPEAVGEINGFKAVDYGKAVQ